VLKVVLSIELVVERSDLNLTSETKFGIWLDSNLGISAKSKNLNDSLANS
jgi:hypothetical protein